MAKQISSLSLAELDTSWRSSARGIKESSRFFIKSSHYNRKIGRSDKEPVESFKPIRDRRRPDLDPCVPLVSLVRPVASPSLSNLIDSGNKF
jgi:hypothetical protein